MKGWKCQAEGRKVNGLCEGGGEDGREEWNSTLKEGGTEGENK